MRMEQLHLGLELRASSSYELHACTIPRLGLRAGYGVLGMVPRARRGIHHARVIHHVPSQGIISYIR